MWILARVGVYMKGGKVGIPFDTLQWKTFRGIQGTCALLDQMNLRECGGSVSKEGGLRGRRDVYPWVKL